MEQGGMMLGHAVNNSIVIYPPWSVLHFCSMQLQYDPW
jgi:hypothetical protein